MSSNQSFHRCVGPILVLGQIAGQLPVSGVMGKSHTHLKFKWKSARTIYSLVYLIFGTIELAFMFERVARKALNVSYAEVIIFYIACIIESMIFFHLARNWKSFMKFWYQKEKVFLSHPYKEVGINLALKIRGIALFFFLNFCMDHILLLVLICLNNLYQMEHCDKFYDDFFPNLVRRQKPHFMKHIPYHFWQIPIYEWIQILVSFCWNFTDLFIVIICEVITRRFDQFNDRIFRIYKSKSEDEDWSEIFEHFVQLCDLVEYVDKKISLLVLLTMGHNLFLIITGIFQSFNSEDPSPFAYIYFWFHTFYLLVQTLSVMFSASKVHLSSKSSLHYLRWMKHWGTDIHRLHSLMMKENVVITGRKFFSISRGLILGMASSVLTFEIILLDEVSGEPPALCEFKY